jgi:ABC-type Fe3+/spermidine/putrescine transport system ATPase subunit
MHVFINEGTIVLRDFVENVFENKNRGEKLEDFMKANNILDSTILKKKKKLIKKDILEQMPNELKEKKALYDMHRYRKIDDLIGLTDDTRSLLLVARSKSFRNQIDYLWKKVYDDMMKLCEKHEASVGAEKVITFNSD